MAQSEIDVCNIALAEIGANEIMAWDEGSEEAITCRDLYYIVLDSLISTRKWTFCIAGKKLPELVDEESLFGFEHIYQLPNDMVMPYNMQAFGRVKRVGNTIHSNIKDPVLEYTKRIDEAAMPAYFINLLATTLAAKICKGLTGNTARGQELRLEAQSLLTYAKNLDSRFDTPFTVRNYSIIGAR